MRTLFSFLSFFLFTTCLWGQFPHQDILRYDFSITLNDSTNVIEGVARVNMLVDTRMNEVRLDFVDVKDGKGMHVDAIIWEGDTLPFVHKDNLLTIQVEREIPEGDSALFEIVYHGEPANGLIISKNKHGNRTFFGDNWPNRAHHWLPIIDHPSDKAYVTWRVTAPDHYKVIANGDLIEKGPISTGIMHHEYSSRVPLPTKVMVIGVADFAVKQVGMVGDKPVTAWVFPEEQTEGFYDYAMATEVLTHMEQYIGSYPFAKLANVQSKTMFGGMENASCIFYHENSIDGKRGETNLFAHEIAHQWFGNSATESDWSHIWLSEGFATYFTHLWVEHSKGTEAMRAGLLQDKQRILAFSKLAPNRPICDTAETDLMKLLNPNSYQKGSWVLHMLRHRIGDKKFQKTIRQYYDTYKLQNATSADFQRVAESISEMELDAFFTQWLRWPGIPQIAGTWDTGKKGGKLKLRFTQNQSQGSYQLSLDLDIYLVGQKNPIRKTIMLDQAEQSFDLKLPKMPIEKIILDPETWILMDATLKRK